MKTVILALLITTSFSSVKANACGSNDPLETVPSLDVSQYLGKWYEIAAIPQSFQKDCVATTATYSLRDDGDIKVLNECRKKTLDGKLDQAEGKAWIPDLNEPSKLKVQFFWPFSAKYWVIELGENYEYSVVGHPNRKYLWILSRSNTMDEKLYADILARLETKGFDTNEIKKTLQVE